MGLKYEKPVIRTYNEEEILKENAKLISRCSQEEINRITGRTRSPD